MRMPLGLRIRSFLAMRLGSDERRKAMMRELGRRKRYTQPRETIAWHPTVDAERCDGCGGCVSFCPRSVYAKEPGPARVINPQSCVLLCSRCAERCPRKAISFPVAADFRRYVYYV